MTDESLPIPSSAQTAREWAPQFESSDRLLDVIWRTRPRVVRYTPDSFGTESYRLVLVHILGRSISTYRAILRLCRGGLPSEGLMLCRSLFEDVVAVHWAALPNNRSGLVERIVRQERLSDETSEKVWADFVGREHEPQLSDDALEALKKEFRGGKYSWFGDLGSAKRAVRETLAERGYSVNDFDFYDRVVGNEANMQLHNTVSGLVRSSRGGVNTGGGHYPSFGQSIEVDEREMQMTLLTAAACMTTIATVILREHDVDVDEVVSAGSAASKTVLTLTPSKRRGMGRNDPCWCGSGRKLKQCHEI